MKPQGRMIVNYCFMMLTWGFVLSSQTSFAQLKSHSFEQIDSLQKVEEKPIAVFIHTSWCKYCGLMRNTTLRNKHVIELLNQNYYFIDFDAEDKRAISFRNHSFTYKPTGNNTGVHQLATLLGTVNGSISYPVFCILNTNYEIVFQYNQYLSPQDMQHILAQLK